MDIKEAKQVIIKNRNNPSHDSMSKWFEADETILAELDNKTKLLNGQFETILEVTANNFLKDKQIEKLNKRIRKRDLEAQKYFGIMDDQDKVIEKAKQELGWILENKYYKIDSDCRDRLKNIFRES